MVKTSQNIRYDIKHNLSKNIPIINNLKYSVDKKWEFYLWPWCTHSPERSPPPCSGECKCTGPRRQCAPPGERRVYHSGRRSVCGCQVSAHHLEWKWIEFSVLVKKITTCSSFIVYLAVEFWSWEMHMKAVNAYKVIGRFGVKCWKHITVKLFICNLI